MESSKFARLTALRNDAAAIGLIGFLFGVVVFVGLAYFTGTFAIISSFVVLMVVCLLVRKVGFTLGSIFGSIVGFVLVLGLAVAAVIG
ncbi:MAG: hypothetical protein ABSE82_11125 [Nitrososphaerales archaeon]|jgi:hypothetical protein